MTGALLVAFWASIGWVAWTWLGFPVLLALRALRPKPPPRTHGPLPDVSLVIVVHNEAHVIDAKLANLERQGYPREKLEVVVSSDGSNDGTDVRVLEHSGTLRVELVALERVGKNAALNAGVAAAKGEILVFSDADALLEPDALARLVAPFADPTIGAVAGDFRYDGSAKVGRGERGYWSVDRVWKRLESRAGSVTSATGQLYAVRRHLFRPVPDGVTDDFFVSTAAVDSGLRLWFEPGAVARGAVVASADAEFRRRVRLIGRGFASVWKRRRLLDPRRTGFYALQLLTHKVLRRLTGLPMIVLAISAPILWEAHPFFGAAALAQGAFHGLAGVGFAMRHRDAGRAPWLALPLAFDAAFVAGLIAFADFLRGRSARGWIPDRGTSPAPDLPASPTSAEEV